MTARTQAKRCARHNSVWRRLVCTMALVVAPACGSSEARLSDGLEDVASLAAAHAPVHEDAIVKGRPVQHDEHSAVLFLLAYRPNSTPPQFAGCTAVRIRPDVILTAAHCFEEAYKMGMTHFLVSSDPAPLTMPTNAKRSFVAVSVVHPDYATRISSPRPVALSHADLALGFLSDADLDGDVAHVTSFDGLDAATRDTPLHTVAYGLGAQSWFRSYGAGIKRSATLQVRDVGPATLKLEATDATLCMGDSGAPLFASDAPDVVLGILSGGSQSFFGFCQGPSLWTRLESFQPWIDREIARQCDTGRRAPDLCAAYP